MPTSFIFVHPLKAMIINAAGNIDLVVIFFIVLILKFTIYNFSF